MRENPAIQGKSDGLKIPGDEMAAAEEITVIS